MSVGIRKAKLVGTFCGNDFVETVMLSPFDNASYCYSDMSYFLKIFDSFTGHCSSGVPVRIAMSCEMFSIESSNLLYTDVCSTSGFVTPTSYVF